MQVSDFHKMTSLHIDITPTYVIMKFITNEDIELKFDYISLASYQDAIIDMVNRAENLDYFILDFSYVCFLDSCGVGLLIHIKDRLKSTQLVLTNIKDECAKVFDFLNLPHYFIIINGEDKLKQHITRGK